MNILVGVSHVPDTTTRINVASDNVNIDKTGVKYILNPYDEFAVEEALKLRDLHKGEVTVISVGAEVAKEAIRQALAMGADKGVLVKTVPSTSMDVAKAIATVAREMKPDLIMLGKQSIDFDGMEIGPMLSELLEWPAATVVVSLKIEGTKATVEKEVEGGKETIEMTMPCIVGAQKGLNDPRYPSLPNIMKAKQKPIQESTVAEPTSIRVTLVKIDKREKKRANKVLKVEGNAALIASQLAHLLHDEAKVI
jgi:electron transfer flavoprotein beta subunit